GEQCRAQHCRIVGHDRRLAGTNGQRRLHPPEVRYRGRTHEFLGRELRHDGRCEDHNVGGSAAAQLVGHGADRAKLAGDVIVGQRLEFRCETADQTLGRAAAQDVKAAHGLDSIAATSLSRVIGRSRTRTLNASNTALAIAAVTGPWAASPAPTGSISGRWMISTWTSGTSLKRRIG